MYCSISGAYALLGLQDSPREAALVFLRLVHVLPGELLGELSGELSGEFQDRKSTTCAAQHEGILFQE